tara:strand:- start:10210 stop:13809 length:3600 start_codon:yes stop_codon:yes gene_type:complete
VQTEGGKFADGSGSAIHFITAAQTGSMTVLSASYALSSSHEITYEVSSSYAETASLASCADQIKTTLADGQEDPHFLVFSRYANEAPTCDVLHTTPSLTYQPDISTLKLQGKFYVAGSGLTINNGSISGSGNIHMTGSINTLGNISASGDINATNISASGDIIMNEGGKLYFDGNDPAGWTPVNTYLHNPGTSDKIEAYVGGVQKFAVGKEYTTFYNPFKVSGNVTASGDISASGDLTANNVYSKKFRRMGSTTDLIDFSVEDTIDIKTSGTKLTRITDDLFSINYNGADLDFAVEGDNDNELIYADAGEDKVGIGNKPTAASSKFSVTGDVHISSHLTASGDISSSGMGTFSQGITLTDSNYDANGTAKYRVDGYSVLQNSSDTLKIAGNNYWTKITYGNEITDQHSFTGDITGSADISASGEFIASAANLDQIKANANFSTLIGLAVGGITHTVGGANVIELTNKKIELGTAANMHTTASGNFSSSANIYASDYWIEGKTAIDYTKGSSKIIFGQNNQNARLRGATIELGGSTSQHVSSSGNILVQGSYISSSQFIGDLTGSVLGAATNATFAEQILFTNNESENAYMYIPFADGNSGQQELESDSQLTYNPLIGYLKVPYIGSGQGWVSGSSFRLGGGGQVGKKGHWDENRFHSAGSIGSIGGISTTGSISASGQISSSGTGENYLGGDLNMKGADIVLDNNQKLKFINTSGASEFGNIFMNTSNDMIYQNNKSGGNVIVKAGNSGNKGRFFIQQGGTSTDIAVFGKTGDLNLTGNFTASSNISASGDIIASGVLLDNGASFKFASDTANEIRMRGHNGDLLFISGSDTGISINPGQGHITASGDISSSGTIIAPGANFIGDVTLEKGHFKTGVMVLDNNWGSDTHRGFLFDNKAAYELRVCQGDETDTVLTLNSVTKFTKFNGPISSSGYISTLSHITASGHISSSDRIIAPSATFETELRMGDPDGSNAGTRALYNEANDLYVGDDYSRITIGGGSNRGLNLHSSAVTASFHRTNQIEVTGSAHTNAVKGKLALYAGGTTGSLGRSGTQGWESVVSLPPTEFASNDNATTRFYGTWIRGQGGSYARVSLASVNAFASYVIPAGYKVTKAMVYASDGNFHVYGNDVFSDSVEEVLSNEACNTSLNASTTEADLIADATSLTSIPKTKAGSYVTIMYNPAAADDALYGATLILETI